MKEDDKPKREAPKPASFQKNNPLHGVKLKDVMNHLYEVYGWDGLAERININCFKSNPTINSSLKFLRKQQWARDKVERLYLRSLKKQK